MSPEIAERFRLLEIRVENAERELEKLRESGAVRGDILKAPFRVVDSDGRVLMEVTAVGSDGVLLQLFNGRSITGASLAVDGMGNGVFCLRNTEGNRVAYINVEANSTRFLLNDHSGQTRLALFADNDEGGGLNVMGPQGNLGMDLWSGKDGGKIRVYDQNEEGCGELPSG